jgi:hypothetical protein
MRYWLHEKTNHFLPTRLFSLASQPSVPHRSNRLCWVRRSALGPSNGAVRRPLARHAAWLWQTALLTVRPATSSLFHPARSTLLETWWTVHLPVPSGTPPVAPSLAGFFSSSTTVCLRAWFFRSERYWLFHVLIGSRILRSVWGLVVSCDGSYSIDYCFMYWLVLQYCLFRGIAWLFSIDCWYNNGVSFFIHCFD